jgi:hypothetical protein
MLQLHKQPFQLIFTLIIIIQSYTVRATRASLNKAQILWLQVTSHNQLCGDFSFTVL